MSAHAHVVFADGPHAGWTMSLAEASPTAGIVATAVAPWAHTDEVRPSVARTHVDVGQPGHRLLSAGLGGEQAALLGALRWLCHQSGTTEASYGVRVPPCPRHEVPLVPAPLARQQVVARMVVLCPRVGCGYTRNLGAHRNLRR